MPERLRVLLVLGPSTGGIGVHARDLARSLVAAGDDVTVCAPHATAARFGWADLGVTFVPAPVASARPVDWQRASRALRSAARGVDVVHAHGTRAGAQAALLRLSPLVLTWHNAPPQRGAAARVAGRLLERVATRGAAVSLAASDDLAARVRAAGGRDVRFAPVAAPPPLPARRSGRDVRAELAVGDGPLVLCVARVAPQKRLDVLVEATAGWADEPEAPAVVVAGDGPGDALAALQAAADRARSPLRLLGPRTDVPDLLAAADVLVLTSDWEARPLVVQEAMAAGVPVVATAVGGVPDLVGDAAVLVAPAEPAELSRALRRLLADPEERRRLAAAGIDRALSWPTPAEAANQVREVYLDLISR